MAPTTGTITPDGLGTTERFGMKAIVLRVEDGCRRWAHPRLGGKGAVGSVPDFVQGERFRLWRGITCWKHVEAKSLDESGREEA